MTLRQPLMQLVDLRCEGGTVRIRECDEIHKQVRCPREPMNSLA